MTLSDRIAVLSSGEPQQLGPPREIYQRPANRFVAEFFGTPKINVVPARLFGLGEGEIGVRPEHVEIAREGIEAVVELVELTGAEAWVTAAVDGTSLVVRAPSDFTAPPGARIHLRFERDKALHL
jgi:multiple sugar transport system ATP-binding protein